MDASYLHIMALYDGSHMSVWLVRAGEVPFIL